MAITFQMQSTPASSSCPRSALPWPLPKKQDISGKFGEPSQSGSLFRLLGFSSLPAKYDRDSLWHGYARRYINAYAPHFREGDEWLDKKYTPVKDAEDEEEVRKGHPKTFNHLACEERTRKTAKPSVGKVGRSPCVKGDVDNLGTIFQQGLSAPTFAKMAALLAADGTSLFQLAGCLQFRAEKYPDTYTVFAGGQLIFPDRPVGCKPRKLAAEMC